MNRQRGFTLIELTVALFIFGLLAAAGVLLLRGSVNAQGAVKAHLDDMALVERAGAAMTADLAQATARISRNEAGRFVPAFWGQSSDPAQPLVRLVRAGWSNLDGAPRPSLQKIEYRYANGVLSRVAYPMLDGAAPGQPSPLLDNVRALSFRYRNSKGEWMDQWQPRRPDRLPLAVEMRLSRAGQAPLTLLFLVGPGGGGADKEADQ